MSDKVRLGIIGLGAEGGMYATFLDGGLVENMTIGANNLPFNTLAPTEAPATATPTPNPVVSNTDGIDIGSNTGSYGIKGVITVDEDIQADDLQRVMWALSCRYDPMRGTELIRPWA